MNRPIMKRDNRSSNLRSCSCVSGLPRTRRRRSAWQRHPLTVLIASLTPAIASGSQKPSTRNLRSSSNQQLDRNLLSTSVSNKYPLVSTAAKKKYPYIPTWSADTCTATRPAESWETSSSSLTDCCTKSYGWQVEICVMKGQALEAKQKQEEDVEYKYIPDWSARTCYNDKPPPNDWVDQYTTLKACCTTNFEWVLKDCLGEEATDDEDTDALDPSRSYWYPQFSNSKCLIHSDEKPAPEYMLQDPENELYPTFKECCQSNFLSELKACKEASRLDTPPTRPPAADSTLVVVPISFKKYYYPRYTENKCLYNGEDAPNYMKNDPITYLSVTVQECCQLQFPLNTNECLYNSGALLDEDKDGFIEERWRDHYYPLFSKVGCINDNKFDDYVKESPSAFLFTTIELCCSSDNFDSGDYEMCLKNSVDVKSLPEEGDMVQNSDQVEVKKVPLLRLDFGGRLYFQNVFIPSGNRGNMIAVKDAILFAIEGVFQSSQYKIDATVAKNFDGIDLSGLRRLQDQQDQSVELTGLRHSSQHQGVRELGKMQVFSFLITFTIECGAACGRDGKVYGRQESLKIAELFDDAVQDESMFNSLKTSMDEQGLIGPFFSASLSDGVMLYEKAEIDMRGATFSPTLQPSHVPSNQPSYFPSSSPSKKPSARPTLHPTSARPTKVPSNSPTLSSSPTEAIVYQFYPNMNLGTCVADGKHTRWEINFYDTLEECCKFPWLEYSKCLAKVSKMPTSGPTAHPTKTPSHTNLPTSKSPSKNPSKAPITSSPSIAPITPAPSNAEEEITTTTTTTTTGVAVTSVPTQRPSGSPTLEPCDNKWHVSIDPNQLQTCTNSLEYPSAWNSSPGLRMKMLLDTPEICCDDNFKGRECNIIYVCGGPSEPESSTPDEGGSCDKAWHLSLEKGKACTNNDNYRKEWPQVMFYTSGEACCQKHFGMECEMIDDCSSSPAPDNTEPSKSCENKWHMATDGTKNTCTNDLSFPASWTNPHIAKNTLFDTPELCCDKFFPTQECNLRDVCTTPAAAPTPANPTTTKPTDCSSNPWHVSTDGSSSTCTNDKNVPEAWVKNPAIAATQLLDTAQLCCERQFSNKVCHIVDICTGEVSSNGFYPVFKWPGCTNDNNPPDYMKDDLSFFFKSIEDCCSSSNFEVTDYDLCLEKSVDVPPPATTTTTTTTTSSSSSQVNSTSSVPESSSSTSTTTSTTLATSPQADCGQKWHVSTSGAKDTCSNSLAYPDAWNKPQIAAQQLFDTSDSCCLKYYSNKPVCHLENTCPPDESSNTETSTSTTTSSAPDTTTASTSTTTTTTTTLADDGSISLDWESKEIPDFVKFEGLGTWKIDMTQPCCRTGVAIHPPNLLPGEYTSMVIGYTTPPGGGIISFNYNMGMGKFAFLIDGVNKVQIAVPGGGLKTFTESLSAGEHIFTWKYEPPSQANLPLSSVWIDNIEIK